MISANQLIAETLAHNQIQYCFGITGVPIIELGYAIQAQNIRYFGFRNEQSASYAANAIGYLTQKPALCLVVSGPGLVHALAGMANAQVNNWPLLVMAGASEEAQKGLGGFQEMDQMNAAKPYVKFSARINDIKTAPHLINMAIRQSMVGKPGVSYIELPGDLLRQQINSELIHQPNVCLEVPKMIATDLNQFWQVLALSSRPLLVIGKGAAYSRAELELREFINNNHIPFLPTPMGKGVIPDSHPLNTSSARSLALKSSDLVILVGARLNWMMHFGQEPRYQKNVKIMQIDINPDEFGSNNQVNLCGDIRLIFKELNKQGNRIDKNWMGVLREKMEQNNRLNKELMNDQELPLQYYSSLGIISQYLPQDCVYIGEGSNTMDIGRTIISHENARLKLDAGSFGTMGVGMGFAIGAKLVYPDKQVFAIMGDSAFGFSGMEFETATRYQLPIVVIVINNGGVFFGVEEISKDMAITALNPQTRYDQLGQALGGKGIMVETHKQLHEAMQQVIKDKDNSYVINVKISPYGQKKPQEHGWLTQSKL